LTVLHEHVTSKRTRSSPIASLEPVMLLFVELCVDLRKGKAAKDGLYQYKNIAQNTNVGTIEIVLKKFIELAEQKVTEAQAKADEIQSSLESAAPSSNIEDLEAIETPETILLATVSGEQSRDRTDRAVVTPWLKFLWETYRTVLEILKNNARLEIMYQSTALQAFKFCQKYTRKTEFRRLCELLRNHVQNAAKYSTQMHAINLSEPDTLQRHLDTRFQQLNVAVELELWQEAFRSIEDIHTLLNLSKRPAKNIMMANYYEKLARIFLVSENYLFHAAAYNRYYNLLRLSSVALASGQSSKKENPSVTEAEMTKAASFVLLSALSIPVISTSRSRGALVDVDEARKNKNTRLTNLLGMATAPTRTVLFRDALNKGLLRRVRPEIRELYNILEVDFHPLSICKKITPILKQIGADPEMEKYVVPLQQVILTRLFQQLSQVYESVELKFVYELAQFPEPFQITPAMIEKFIMNGCKKGDLSIRVDHISGVLTFDSDVFSSSKASHAGSGAGSAESEVQRLQNTPAEIARYSVARLAKTLHVTCMYVDPSYNEARLQAKQTAQARALAGAAQEHEETLARRVLIDKKKEAATDALQKKQRDEENRKRIRTQQLQDAEKQRLADEQRDRELKRIKDEQDRIRQEELKKQLEELKTGVKGIDVSEIDLEELDANRLRAMKLAQLEKEKNELNDRIRTTAKRIDHLERAFRREELKHIASDYEAQKKLDMELYEKQKAEALQESKLKHAEAVALKHRLGRLVPQFSSFRKEVSEKRHEEFEKRRKAAEREFEAKKKQRVKEVQERRRRERQEREEEELRRKEEEERAAREEQERTAREEERRRALAEEKAKREEERSLVFPHPKPIPYLQPNRFNSKLDEIALKQQQREAEAEARLAARRTGGGLAERTERTAPRLNVAPRTAAPSSWREREAAREAGGAPAPAPVREEPARKIGGGYVPPHLRAGASAGTGSAPPPREPREPREAPTERWAPRHTRESSSQSPSPAPPASAPKAEGSGGKWVPRWKQQQ
jgi:translation initiation factor 3 subunit A